VKNPNLLATFHLPFAGAVCPLSTVSIFRTIRRRRVDVISHGIGVARALM
jgi:hypothetical protein